MIQELLTKISNELKYSHEMDAPPRPLCSVTIKGEPDEIDMDLPFKTSVKTELVDFEETVLHELVPEFPMELKYSPQIYLSAQPFCSVVDTDLSFKSLPRTDVDDLKIEMPDDNSDGNSSNGSSPNCASYSFPSSSGRIWEIPPIGNLCNSKDEVIAPYLCTRCQSRFGKECQLRSHLHSHHQSVSEDVGFSCFVCNKMYIKRAEFMRHILDFHPRVCPVCRETFQSCWDLHEHLSKYSEDDSYSCPRCYQVYSTTTDLEQHMHIKDYNCKLCYKKFRNHCAFNQHNKSHLQEVLTYDMCCKSNSKTYAVALQDSQLDCPKCEKTFTTQESLINHFKVHKPWRCVMCDTCNKMFLNRSLPIHHIVAHADVRPFTCSTCKMRFKRTTRSSVVNEGHSRTIEQRPI